MSDEFTIPESVKKRSLADAAGEYVIPDSVKRRVSEYGPAAEPEKPGRLQSFVEAAKGLAAARDPNERAATERRGGNRNEVKPYVPADDGMRPGEAGQGRGSVNPSQSGADVRPLTLEQAGKDFMGGVEQVKALGTGAAAFAGSASWRQWDRAMADMDAIDTTGKPLPRAPNAFGSTDVSPYTESYALSDPQTRQAIRQRVRDGLMRDEQFIGDSIKAIQGYNAEQQKLSGKMPDFTDIRTAKDFAVWAVRNGIATSPTMAASMIGALAGPGGLAATSGGMALGDMTSARAEFAGKAFDPKRFGSADRQADALAQQQGLQAQHLGDSVGATAALAAPYAALDFLGPAGTLATGGARGLASQGVRKIVAQGAKEMGAEAVNEGGQEIVNIGSDMLAGERSTGLTAEDAKRVANAAAVGGLMGVGGHAANVGGDAVKAAANTPERQIAREIDKAAADYGKQTEAMRPTEQRKAVLAKLDDFAAEHGLSPKAVAAIKDKTATVPLAQLGARIKAAIQALRQRDLFGGPTDDQALAGLEQAGVATNEDVSKVQGAARSPGSETAAGVLPTVPRGSDAGVAQDAPADAGAERQGNQPGLRSGVQAPGEAQAGAVQGLQKPGIADPSRGLQQTTAGNLAVQGVPSGEASKRGVPHGTTRGVDTGAIPADELLGTPTEDTPPASIDDAAHQAATSPRNDLPEPTDAQKEAGNYRKGHVRIDGMDVSIENPAGSIRRSKADAPTPWEVTMPGHYGYIKGTTGSDGDHVDLFIGGQGGNGRYWVINQNHADGAGHDEHKVITGVNSADEAVALYKQSFADNFGDKVFGSVSAEFNADQIKANLPAMSKAKPVLKPAAPAAPDAKAKARDDLAAGLAELGGVLGKKPGAPRRGVIGDKLASGEVVTTSSGRQTTPFPKVSVDTDRKAAATFKAVDQWLMQNAAAEAEARGDEFNARQFRANVAKPSPADKDSAEEYLFGEQPAVPRSSLKPLAPTAAGPRVIARAGRTPTDTQDLELRSNADGSLTPHLGGKPLVDFDSGEPIKLAAGVTDLDAKKAIRDAGALSKKVNFFPAKGSADTSPPAEASQGATNGDQEEGRRQATQEVLTPAAGTPVGSTTSPAAPDKRSARAKARRALDPESDSVLEALAKLGGIRRDVVQREYGMKPEELKHTVNVGGLKGFPFRAKGGMDLDSAITSLREAGYFVGIGDADAANEFERAIFDELGGSRTLTPQGQMARAAQMSKERADEERARQASDDFDPFEPSDTISALDDFTPDDLEASGYADASDEVKALTQQLLADAESAGLDTEALREDAAKGIDDQSEDFYHARLQDLIRKALAGPQADGQGGDAQAAGGGSEDRGVPDGGQGQEGADEGLTDAQRLNRARQLQGLAPSDPISEADRTLLGEVVDAKRREVADRIRAGETFDAIPLGFQKDGDLTIITHAGLRIASMQGRREREQVLKALTAGDAAPQAASQPEPARPDLTLAAPTRAQVLAQQAAKEQEQADRDAPADKPVSKLTGEQPDMFNTQASVFDAPAEPEAASGANVIDLRGERELRDALRDAAAGMRKAERDEVLHNLNEVRAYLQTGALSEEEARTVVAELQKVADGGDFDDAMEVVDPILTAAGKKQAERTGPAANEAPAPAPAPAEPAHFADIRNKTRAYWDSTAIPAIRDYLRAFDAFGADRLERNKIKPEGMSARQWLESFVSRQSTWDKGRKTGQTGIQYLGTKNLWPTEDGSGERLRKAALEAVKALKNAPSTSGELMAEAFMERTAPAPTQDGPTPNYKPGDRITPDKDVIEGDVVLYRGQQFMAKVKRGKTIPLFPMADGKPQVNADAKRVVDLTANEVTHTGANVYGYGGQPKTAPSAPAAPAELPTGVQTSIRWALGRLNDAKEALSGVERARGRGHMLKLEWDDQQAKIKEGRDKLAEIRDLAKNNGATEAVEAYIREQGGEPELDQYNVTPVTAPPSPAAPEKSPTDAIDEPAILALGFKKSAALPNTWARAIDETPNRRINYSLRKVGGTGGYPVKWMLTRSATFPGTGITGSPSQELGPFGTQAEAIDGFKEDRATAVATGSAAPGETREWMVGDEVLLQERGYGGAADTWKRTTIRKITKRGDETTYWVDTPGMSNAQTPASLSDLAAPGDKPETYVTPPSAKKSDHKEQQDRARTSARARLELLADQAKQAGAENLATRMTVLAMDVRKADPNGGKVVTPAHAQRIADKFPALLARAKANPDDKFYDVDAYGVGKRATSTKIEANDSEEVKKAKADLMAGLGDLASLLAKPGRSNITPEEEQKLLPILTKVFDAAFRLGYLKFKEAAKFVLDQIRGALGDEAANAITLDHLQGAYIGMSGRYKDAGASTKKDVVSVEDLAEIESTDNSPEDGPDAPGPDTPVERDRGDAATADAPVPPPVRAPAGQADAGARGAVGQAGSKGPRRADDPGFLAGGTPPVGERGDQRVDRGDEPAGPSGFDAGTGVDQRGFDFGGDGVQADAVADEEVAAATFSGAEHSRKLTAQRAAEKIPVKAGDLANIRETLPYLDAPQQEDVHKAELQHAKPDGYGMLFTNGTGTGKTFSGLGVVKRLARQGKTNQLIVVPDAKIMDDWIESAKTLGLTVTPLASTKDTGRGLTITTYANLEQNDAIVHREFDHVLADEAHQLMQGKDGEATGALQTLRAITRHPDHAYTRYAKLYADDLAEVERLTKAIDAASRQKNIHDMPEDRARFDKAMDDARAKLDPLLKKLDKARKEVAADVQTKQGLARTRATFLSATPFAYVPTVDWANGYLFDYREGYPYEENSTKYNQPSPREYFYLTHFGFRMRYNKLTRPDAKVDAGLMQRQFNGWLRKKGALSSRALDVEPDYDRRFVMLDSAVGNDIDAALRWLGDQADAERKVEKEPGKRGPDGFQALSSTVSSVLYGPDGHLIRRYLLEAIKAKEVVPIVRQHLALGRKLVIFHDFKKGGARNPFNVSPVPQDIIDAGIGVDGPEGDSARKAQQYNDALAAFRAKFPGLVDGDSLKDLLSPIQRFTKEFPDVLLINGDEKPKDLLGRYKRFNDDRQGPVVALVQSAKNKGWSGHDTTGKHQRVLMNLGLPTQPTTSIQQEGRVYRRGVKTDAIMRYLTTGTNWERVAFAETIARRASEAENLSQGENARALFDAFTSAFEEADAYPPGHEGEGKGGKERDRQLGAVTTAYDRAKAFYFGTQKKNARTKAEEGTDYYATPEPVGLKMVEWLDLKGGEDALEPSAGHGAIARWFPDNVSRTAVEPSLTLRSRLALAFDGKIVDTDFEDLHVVNKYDGIAMNPPYRDAGGSYVDVKHVAKAATHLRDGGRIVALLPVGPAAEKRFDKWFYEEASRPIKPLMELDIGMGKEPLYRGDTIKTGVSWQSGVVTGRTDTGYLRVKTGQPGETLVPEKNVTAIARTGPRTETYKPAEGLYLLADIRLPSVTFERAATNVMTRIVVIEKQSDQANAPAQMGDRDLTAIDNINDLFDRMEDMAMPLRPDKPEPVDPKEAKAAAKEEKAAAKAAGAEVAQKQGIEMVEHTTGKGKLLKGVIRSDLSFAQAKEIDRFTFKKDGGWFIREEHLPTLLEKHPPAGGLNLSVADEEDIDALLEEFGEPVTSRMDAERRFSDGDRIFAMHDLSDTAHELRNFDDLKAYTPDQMLALPAGAGDLNLSAAERAARAAAGRIGANGVRSSDDLRDMLRVPGYSQWARSAVARNVDAARALRDQLQAEFSVTDWRAPKLNDQGVVTFYASWADANPEGVARAVEIADQADAPMAMRGGAGSDALGKSLRAAGFVPYMGAQERAERPVAALFSLIRPAGGITATTPLFTAAKGWGSVDAGGSRADTARYAADPDRNHLRAVDVARESIAQRKPGYLLRAVVAPGGRPDLRAAAAVGRGVAGHRVVFVRQDGDRVFNGAAFGSPGHNYLLIDVDSAQPVMAVTGHEVLHRLRAARPDLYDKLNARISAVLRNEGAYADKLRNRYADLGLKPLPDDKIHEELLADVFGDEWGDPEFWRALAKSKPQGLRAIAEAVAKYLDDLVSRIIKLRPFGTEQYLTDLRAAREAVLEATREFQKGEVGDTGDMGDIAFSAADQTNTEAFRKWFGDSKVVDAQGKPLVVYHGTERAGFAAFDPSRAGDNTGRKFSGIYFTNAKTGASTYSGTRSEATVRADDPEFDPRYDGEPGNYSVFLSMKDPLVVDFKGEGWDAEIDDDGDVYFGMDDVVQRAIDAEHDGVIARNISDEGRHGQGYGWGDTTYVVFRPEQIKSAIGNRGTFDPENADIRLSVADAPTARGGALRPSTGIVDTILRKAGGSLVARLTSPGYDRLLTLLDNAGRAIGGEPYLYAKAGLVADYGLTEGYKAARGDMQTGIRKGTREAATIIDQLQVLDRAQSRVAYLWMQEKPNTELEHDLMASLPQESRLALTQLKERIDQLGRQAVDLGLLSRDTYERNAMAYLHRSYKKYEQSDVGAKPMRAKSIRILGDQFKGRGLRDDVAPDKIGAPDWWQRRERDGAADASLKGQKFHRLELRALPDTATPDMHEEAGRPRLGRLQKVVYWPASEAIPRHLADWRNDGQWEARFFDKGGKVGMWRDFTLDERTQMGEIQEVRYSAGKTMLQAVRDIETARLLDWVARNVGEPAEDRIPEGHTVVKATESLTRSYLDTEWVQVPDAKIPDTGGLKRYGNLAGRYIPGPVWNDIRQITALTEQGDVARAYQKLLTMWKISKTALSPATHTNNVMSNFILADAHDIQGRHMLQAAHAWLRHRDRGNLKADPVAKQLIEDYQDNGGDGGKFNEGELREDVMGELLAQLERDVNEQDEATARLSAAQVWDLLSHREFRQAFAAIGKTKTAGMLGAPARKLIHLYGREDELFRLAAFIKARADGLSDHDAGKFARESFLDYSINAPWINALRRTAFPFIAFTYRAVPMLLRTFTDKPHKLAKYALIAGALNALAYSMSGGDEDKERALLPDEKAGKIWGIFPKLLRMPWNDEHGSPVFLDVRRWIPGGDVIDTNANHGAVPIPAPLVPGGPLVMVGEVVLNRQGFTGQAITKETDTATEQWAKFGDYLWKATMPNFPGLPGSYSTEALMNAGKGKTDVFGREQNLGQAAVSAVGVKVSSYPRDTLERNAALDTKAKIREIQNGLRSDARQMTRKGMTEAEFKAKVEAATEKIEKLNDELRKKLGQAQGEPAAP